MQNGLNALVASIPEWNLIYSLMQVSYWLMPLQNTGLFEMVVGVMTTCHTQYT